VVFPAPPDVDEDADASSNRSVGLNGEIGGNLESDLPAAPAVHTGPRDRADDDGDDLDDEDALTDVQVEGQLQLGSLGVLPELAGLPEREAAYARAARAKNTLCGYRSDWVDFTTWCTSHDADPMPATPAALTGYLVALAQAGAKVGTLSRRLSSIKFAHASAGHPDPATHPRVMAVLEGIRRMHGAPPQQATPLMPPLLFDVLTACPTTRTWPMPAATASGRRSRSAVRAPEPDLLGARDRALLLVGFVGALRRSDSPPSRWPTSPSTPTAWCCPYRGPRPTRPASMPSSSSCPARATPTAAPSWRWSAGWSSPASPRVRCSGASPRPTVQVGGGCTQNR